VPPPYAVPPPLFECTPCYEKDAREKQVRFFLSTSSGIPSCSFLFPPPWRPFSSCQKGSLSLLYSATNPTWNVSGSCAISTRPDSRCSLFCWGHCDALTEDAIDVQLKMVPLHFQSSFLSSLVDARAFGPEPRGSVVHGGYIPGTRILRQRPHPSALNCFSLPFT